MLQSINIPGLIILILIVLLIIWFVRKTDGILTPLGTCPCPRTVTPAVRLKKSRYISDLYRVYIYLLLDMS
ncbi:hypothetical protein PIL02S_06946 [Paenibacillus illinoisensis]|uniref:Uncharacterized protein n=1 Tax=Paenibacillus illinoisensis TaxID=59845 RepID=A0A2W0C108_9BACL|nr:hypothetical protein PIL02S_06946 [Paenibacillus illinoisensis]